MKFIAMKLLVLAAVLSGTVVLASGFRCESDSGHTLKIYNYVNGEDGTRIPSIFVLSNDDGTLLVARRHEISKRNLSDVVQYSVLGNEKVNAERVIAQIRFKEGRETIEAGELVEGTLILVRDSDRDISQMICSRYKKH